MTAVVPEVIQHLDITPACERNCTEPMPPAEFVAYFHMPCTCHFIILVCKGCVATFNYPGFWACLKGHTNLGRPIDWCRIESLGA